MKTREVGEFAGTRPGQFVVFGLDEQRYALHLAVVERVVPLVEITPLPNKPEIVLGVVNVEGRVIPVVDIRKRFHLPTREMDPRDHLVLTHTSRRPVALVADQVSGVVEIPDGEVVEAGSILPRIGYVEGVAKLQDGLILIHDLDQFLCLEEETQLEAALHDSGRD